MLRGHHERIQSVLASAPSVPPASESLAAPFSAGPGLAYAVGAAGLNIQTAGRASGPGLL